jgi:hydrogenase maturation protein HypF
VQHHHAHAAACLAEHGHAGPALALVLDGFGHGDDGGAWGGELLHVTLAHAERVAHLEAVGLPGGDAAAREPWRMATAWLARAFPDGAPALAWNARRDPARLAAVARLAARSARTSSCGRLLDAAASLLGVCDVASHEAEAASALEALASEAEETPRTGAPPGAPVREIEAASLIRALVAGLREGAPPAALARAFSDALADRLADAALAHARARAVGVVALGGGCFQSRLLSTRIADALRAGGVTVLRPRALPPGDGGLAVGQATVALARLAGRW